MKQYVNNSAEGARRAVFAPADNRARVDAVIRRPAMPSSSACSPTGSSCPARWSWPASSVRSTVTLREALMALRQQGLVTTRRRGGGSFVSLPEVPGEELRVRLAGWSTEELRDLGDHWAALSGAAAQLAAELTSRATCGNCGAHWTSWRPPRTPRRAAGLHGRFHVELAAVARVCPARPASRSRSRRRWGHCCVSCSGTTQIREEVADRHRSVISAVQDGAHASARALAERCVQASTARLIALRLAMPRAASGPRPLEGTHEQEPRSGRRHGDA